MEAVLYIGHGSRVREGVQEVHTFINKAKPSIFASIQEVCFLELAQPDIVTGITNCIKKGATMVYIIPLLLLTAVHAKRDIPAEINKAKQLYPHIHFHYGRPFGVHSKMTESLWDRIQEQSVELIKDSSVLLIGRGSSDPAVKKDLTKIATELKQLHPFQRIDVCFMYGASPSFEEGLNNVFKSLHQQVFIIPYLLFTGILKNRISKRIEELQKETDQQLILCESLGYHSNLVDVLVERVNELKRIKSLID